MNGGIIVHFRDIGDDIAPEKLAHVFQPFVQADQPLTRQQDGIGPGLAISQDLARGMGARHGRRTDGERRLGMGSTLTQTQPASGCTTTH